MAFGRKPFWVAAQALINDRKRTALRRNQGGDSIGPTSPAPAITVRSASGVGISSLVAAISSYLILFVTARSLSPADNANFLVFWSALFAIIGVLGGVQSESTRAVGSAAAHGLTPGMHKPASILVNGLAVGAGLALALSATSILWAPNLFPGGGIPGVVAILAVAALAYSGHAAIAGAAAGRQDWTTYSRLMGVEAAWRLVAVGLVVIVGASVRSFEIACIVSAVVWLLFLLFSSKARTAMAARADVTQNRLARQSGHALLSAASTAVLIVGFPILLRLTTSDAEYATAAPLILAISMTRAPIMIPLQAFQGVFITSFLRQRSRGMLALFRPAAVLAGIGLVGSVLAFFIGPSIMTIFGPTYRMPGSILAGLTIDAILMAFLTLTGTAVLAAGRHRAYSSGWLTATAVSLALLFLPVPIDLRAFLSLLVGPACGIIVHCVALSATAARRETSAAGS